MLRITTIYLPITHLILIINILADLINYHILVTTFLVQPTQPWYSFMTCSTFLKMIDHTSWVAGGSPFKGHSIRIGATLKYLLQNVPFNVVKVKGCWASNTFLLYLCKHAQILAPYIQATLALHTTFLQYTIPPIWR